MLTATRLICKHNCFFFFLTLICFLPSVASSVCVFFICACFLLWTLLSLFYASSEYVCHCFVCIALTYFLSSLQRLEWERREAKNVVPPMTGASPTETAACVRVKVHGYVWGFFFQTCVNVSSSQLISSLLCSIPQISVLYRWLFGGGEVDLSPLLLFTLIGYLLGIALRLLLLLMHVCFLLLMNTLLPVALASFNED